MGGVKFNSYTIDKNFTSLMNMKYEELLLILKFARKPLCMVLDWSISLFMWALDLKWAANGS